tara:strand:- start:201 stop:374 length:174 start_codon:yes stop_codon:yes gene_type:complete
MNEEQIVPIVEIIIGTGIIGMLWKMNCQIGAIGEQLKAFSKRTDDHEDRIRTLERKE